VPDPFVDPRPLYATSAPLSTRVEAFGRYLVVDSTSQRLFREVTREVARFSPILDIGCGVGVPLLSVGPTVLDRPDVIAGDLSLRQLRTIGRAASGSLFKLLQFDATCLPFRSGSFGSAVARHMLYHVPDPRQAVAEAARVIRDDGLFVATTNSSNSRPELQGAHTEAVGDLGGRLVDRMSINFDAESGGRKLNGSFREVHAEIWSGVLAFPAVDAVLDYYQSTAYFKMAFDAAADRARLARRVAETLRSQFGDGPAPLTVGGAVFICAGPIRRPRW
jgi:SAM-dependent methyltransferase